jgi:hypothetical protein
MAVPSTFNVAESWVGDHVILSGASQQSWRIRQLNIQNRDNAAETEISVKDVEGTVFGPIILQPKQLLSLELASEEHQHLFVFPRGSDVIVNSSANIPMTVFGFAGLS